MFAGIPDLLALRGRLHFVTQKFRSQLGTFFRTVDRQRTWDAARRPLARKIDVEVTVHRMRSLPLGRLFGAAVRSRG